MSRISQSVSNGIVEPPGDSLALDQQILELTHDVNSGLGSVFNARACAECHQTPVSGGASQFTELRVGHRNTNGNFVNPTIPIDDGASSVDRFDEAISKRVERRSQRPDINRLWHMFLGLGDDRAIIDERTSTDASTGTVIASP